MRKYGAKDSAGIRSQLAQRLKAEGRLRLLSSAVEQSSEGMAVSDLDGNLLFINHAFASMHDYGPEELKGKNLDILHAQGQVAAVKEANDVLLKYGVFAGEVWHARRDGTPFPAFMHNSMLRADDGTPIGMIATMRDVSDQKEAEEKLKQYSERLEQMVEERTRELDRVRADLFSSAKLAAMGRMGAGIAHQLNSPLCGGMLMVDSLMEDARDDPERWRKLSTLRRSLEGMRDVVECMLSLAMVGRRGQPAFLDVNINSMIRRILGFVSLQIQQERIDLHTSFDEAVPFIKARSGELDQIFLNLINNAIDAVDEGGRFEIATIYKDGAIQVEVSDNGRGIAPENLGRIFEPFFTTSQGRKGLGLGLSIVREIVENYGGTIEVTSETGKGSRFLVKIPLNNKIL
ncbi:MAG: PAS domain S-box protein [Proteobacteria bacterium]|nr:PAS domain S-box protein [Pseudomonadota bacterium]